MERSLRTPGAEEVLASIRDAFFAVDRDWRFTYLNGEAERLLARPADELLGRCVWDEFPEATDRAFFREYQEAMREQRTVSFAELFRLAAREAAELLGGEAGAVLKAVDHRRAVIGGIWSAGRASLAEGALVPTGGDL